MIKFILHLFIICFSSSFISAQNISDKDVKSILTQIAENYSGDGYALSYNKKIYKTAGQSTPMENVNGRFILGDKHQYRLEEKGTLIIQNKEINLVVDSNTNEVYVNEVDKEFIPIEIGSFLNDSIYKLYSFELSKERKNDLLTIRSKIDVTSYLQLFFNPIDHQISSFKYFFPKANYFSESLDDETEESPVMILTYQPKEKVKLTEDLFSVTDWFSTQNLPLELNAAKQRFELFDLRQQSYK